MVTLFRPFWNLPDEPVGISDRLFEYSLRVQSFKIYLTYALVRKNGSIIPLDFCNVRSRRGVVLVNSFLCFFQKRDASCLSVWIIMRKFEL